MLSVEEVLRVIGSRVAPVAAERVGLEEGVRCVLAEDVRMSGDSPPFDRAVLDGFAVRSEDALEGKRLQLVGHINAGERFMGAVGPMQCVGINTGAPMPPGADGVLMVENSEVEGDRVGVLKGVRVGVGIQRKGADARDGEVVLPAGVVLGAAQAAAAASAGAGSVMVRRAVAGLLVTGDELVAPDAVVGPGQIRNSNEPMLLALLGRAARVVRLGTCRDDAGVIRERLLAGLREADLLVVTGGMSMGTRDLVPPMLKELGVEILVEKVRIKPGKPFIFGVLKGAGRERYVAGLPGNPVSAFVTFQRFVREILALLAGLKMGGRVVMARTRTALAENGEREFYQPCRVVWEKGGAVAEVMAWKGSADVFTLARAEGLVIRGAEAEAVGAGGVVPVMML